MGIEKLFKNAKVVDVSETDGDIRLEYAINIVTSAGIKAIIKYENGLSAPARKLVPIF